MMSTCPSAAPCRRFAVTVLYREPTYARQCGRSPHTYRFTFDVAASTPAAARSVALEEFERMARLSGVSWVREIVGTLVAAVPERDQ